MGKRATKTKRGTQQRVAKHKIKSKALKETVSEPTFLGIEESVYFSVGRRCFDFSFFCCQKLYLAPFTKTATGEYVPLDGRSKVVHHFTWCLMFLVLLHKAWGLAVILLYEELKVETFMVIALFLTFIDTFCISLGTVVRPKETMDLLNSWPAILECLKELGHGVPSPFDDLSVAFELIATSFMTQGIGLGMALLSLAFSSLPSCYFPLMKGLGIIPDGVLRPFAWQLIFFPLEYATVLPAMLIESFAGSIILIVVGVYKLYTNELRRFRITNLEDRAKLEHLYICMELYGRICFVWVKFALPSILLCCSLTIIIATFVAIRYTELPFFCFVIFPGTALALTIIIFWASVQLVRTIRDSEEILGQLRSYEAPYLRTMRIVVRVKLLKRAKAIRAIDFPVGDFADFSLTVPATLWEEIINQVVFLLTL